MDDCIQVLKYLYSQFEYMFLFDHSNGHDRMKPNGLNINKISVCHGVNSQKCAVVSLLLKSLDHSISPSISLNQTWPNQCNFLYPMMVPVIYQKKNDKNWGTIKYCNQKNILNSQKLSSLSPHSYLPIVASNLWHVLTLLYYW